MLTLSLGAQYEWNLKACSHRAKANAKAKKIKKQKEIKKDPKISGKHQRQFSLSLSLSLGVGRPLRVKYKRVMKNGLPFICIWFLKNHN